MVPACVYGEEQQQQQPENPDRPLNEVETSNSASPTPQLHNSSQEEGTHPNNMEKNPEDSRSLFPKSERRFWMIVIFLAFTLNSMLVAGLTTGIFLLLASDQYKLSTTPEPPPSPTRAPTPFTVMVASEAPTSWNHSYTGPAFPNTLTPTESASDDDMADLVVTLTPSTTTTLNSTFAPTFSPSSTIIFPPPPPPPPPPSEEDAPILPPSLEPTALEEDDKDDDDDDETVKTIPIGAIVGIALVAEILISAFLYSYYRTWKQRRQPSSLEQQQEKMTESSP
jgi:hypothetical protein